MINGQFSNNNNFTNRPQAVITNNGKPQVIIGQPPMINGQPQIPNVNASNSFII
jgi:hypothetical protein